MTKMRPSKQLDVVMDGAGHGGHGGGSRQNHKPAFRIAVLGARSPLAVSMRFRRFFFGFLGAATLWLFLEV